MTLFSWQDSDGLRNKCLPTRSWAARRVRCVLGKGQWVQEEHDIKRGRYGRLVIPLLLPHDQQRSRSFEHTGFISSNSNRQSNTPNQPWQPSFPRTRSSSPAATPSAAGGRTSAAQATRAQRGTTSSATRGYSSAATPCATR